MSMQRGQRGSKAATPWYGAAENEGQGDCPTAIRGDRTRIRALSAPQSIDTRYPHPLCMKRSGSSNLYATWLRPQEDMMRRQTSEEPQVRSSVVLSAAVDHDLAHDRNDG